ncbi:MAG: SAVED domain-containing protein [Oscillospiraceae bacterium]
MKLVGGKEASRGFLYQGFASVLEALTDKNKWDKIYIEFPTSNDKVDIALGAANKVIKSIQVKSTINTFSKSDIMVWLRDLIADIDAPEYELCLIGQCEKSAITFKNSIEKFYNNTLDNTAVKSLDGFSTDLLRNKRINFVILPFEIEVLEKIVRDSLHKYISYSNQMLSFDQISFIASATVNDQMISSTHGDGIDRKKFDEELEKRIFLIADKYSPKRISIAVTSFPRGAVHLEDKTMCLSLVDKFDGRNLKSGYDWNNDIYPMLRDFLISNTKNEHAYQVFLDTHASLAFAAGYVLDSKSGINVFPIQKTAMNGTKLWDVKLSSKKSYSNWSISHEELEENQFDTALILNVTRPIYKDVLEYIKENNLSIGRIINCTPNEGGATNFSIENGNHAATLANSIYSAIAQRSTVERRATLHIFAAAPNAFMFFLGQISRGFGKCVLYEYDFEQRDSCSYSESISFRD